MRFAITVFIVAVSLGSATYVWWDWLIAMHGGSQTGLASIRDIALIGFGVSGVMMVVWRNLTADKQMMTSRQGLLNERFKLGVDLLSSREMSSRVGGAYVLNRIAEEYPDEFHKEVMTILLAFLSGPPQLEERTEVGPAMWVEQHLADDIDLLSPLRADIATVITLIGKRSAKRLEMDEKTSDLLLERADLSKAGLSNLNLSDVRFFSCDFTGARFDGAILNRASFHGCILTDASFHDNGERPATGLSQNQIRMAVAGNGMQPDIEGLTDCETGEKLIWKGITAD